MTGIAPEAAELLKQQRWSGNIRELQNCIEKAVILSQETKLTAKDMQIDAESRPGMTDEGSSERSEESKVREAMERCNGNISAAAKLLGVSRPTLYAKLKKYGL